MKCRRMINWSGILVGGSLFVQAAFFPQSVANASDRKELKRQESQKLRLLLRDVFNLEQGAWQKKLTESDKTEKTNSLRGLLEKTSVRLESDVVKVLQDGLDKIKTTKVSDIAMNDLIRSFRHEVADAFQIDSSPARTPDPGAGQALFQKDCVSCHGPGGNGKGPLTAKLPKKPASWLLPDHLLSQAPLMILNSLLLGSPGSPMPSFESHYSHHELWSLSFLIPCFSFLERLGSRQLQWQKLPQSLKNKLFQRGLNYSFLARRTESELRDWIRKSIPVPERQGWSEDVWSEILRGGAVFSRDMPRR